MKRSKAAPRLVPYVTAREGEYGGPESELTLSVNAFGTARLAYPNEAPGDRGPRGELWARCSQSLDASGKPAGKPRWRLVNPSRQRETMQQLRCQVGFCPAETPRGHIFLAGAADDPGKPVRTAQPPVCPKHVRTALKLCPHFEERHVIYLARTTSVWGVVASRYHLTATGLTPLPAEDDEPPIQYGHPQMGWVLASQLVRELRDYEAVSLNDLASVT